MDGIERPPKTVRQGMAQALPHWRMELSLEETAIAQEPAQFLTLLDSDLPCRRHRAGDEEISPATKFPVRLNEFRVAGGLDARRRAQTTVAKGSTC